LLGESNTIQPHQISFIGYRKLSSNSQRLKQVIAIAAPELFDCTLKLVIVMLINLQQQKWRQHPLLSSAISGRYV
jgi:hypothetical protein